MLQDQYPINEIFYSLQGEGQHSGSPAVFIRLAGCNLACPWCDTDHSSKMVLNVRQIVTLAGKAMKEKGQDVMASSVLAVLTGGEPSIHDLSHLCLRLHHYGFQSIAMETNGTNPDSLLELKSKGLLDWVTWSPKPEVEYDAATMAKMSHLANEIKVVLDGVINPVWYAFSKHVLKGTLYIQPCSEDYESAVEYVLQHPEWKLSVQTQKVIGVL